MHSVCIVKRILPVLIQRLYNFGRYLKELNHRRNCKMPWWRIRNPSLILPAVSICPRSRVLAWPEGSWEMPKNQKMWSCHRLLQPLLALFPCRLRLSPLCVRKLPYPSSRKTTWPTANPPIASEMGKWCRPQWLLHPSLRAPYRRFRQRKRSQFKVSKL